VIWPVVGSCEDLSRLGCTCPGPGVIHSALSLGYEKWNYSYFNNKRKSIEEKRGKLNPQEVLFGHQMALIRLLPQW